MHRGLVVVAGVMLLTGCRTPEPAARTETPDSDLPEPRPASVRPSLRELVRRDATVFAPPRPPASLVEAMASQRVVILGEVHLLQEHHDFVMAALEALHARGTRLLLLESFHAHSRRADRFVTAQTDRLSPATEKFFGYLLGQVRSFNQGLAPAEQVHVAFVDINHAPWALPSALALDQAEVDRAGPQRAFLSAIGWNPSNPYEQERDTFAKAWQSDPERLRTALQVLEAKLDPAADAWLHRAAGVALESLAIKKVWAEQGEDAAHPAREEVIKRLVDRHLINADATVLISIGGYHAQRKHVMGTPKQWLAEHLADPDGPAEGSVYSVYVNVAEGDQWTGTDVRSLAIEDDPTELMWQLADVAGDRAVYLPLTDPYFSATAVPVHYLYRVIEHRPAEQFDAYVLLPHGTLLPSFGGEP